MHRQKHRAEHINLGILFAVAVQTVKFSWVSAPMVEKSEYTLFCAE